MARCNDLMRRGGYSETPKDENDADDPGEGSEEAEETSGQPAVAGERCSLDRMLLEDLNHVSRIGLHRAPKEEHGPHEEAHRHKGSSLVETESTAKHKESRQGKSLSAVLKRMVALGQKRKNPPRRERKPAGDYKEETDYEDALTSSSSQTAPLTEEMVRE